MIKLRRPTYKSFVSIVSSDKFFGSIILLFVVQALWIVFSGRYPMAFDEDFHVGIIKLYAHHISPFWSGQPEGADAFGAIARDPSYLYHLLMSLPYRLVAAISGSPMVQVISLRIINVGLFSAGLVLFRKLLLKTGTSRAIAHLALLVLVLVPVSPLLAAQINYDNLLMPLTALALMAALNVYRGMAKKSLGLPALFVWLILCLATSLVKYAFIPIFAATVVFVLVAAMTKYRNFSGAWRAFANGWHYAGKKLMVLLVILLLLSGGLFVERYGINTVRYHNPIVDCGPVLGYEHCKHYPPWIRNYRMAHSKHNNGAEETSPLSFTQHWFYGMWFRSVFAVDGPGTRFQTRGPLILPGVGIIVFAALGLGALLLAAKRLWRRYDSAALWLFSLASISTIGLLWLKQYQAFFARRPTRCY